MNILISGGSGALGTVLTNKLVQLGHEVRILSRTPGGRKNFFKWDLASQYIDPQAIENLDVVIHLAGAGVADGRWTNERKKEILHSRTNSAQLIYRVLEEHKQKIKHFISAGGLAYYGSAPGQTLTEDSPNGTSFLADVCTQWEQSAHSFRDEDTDVSVLRIGIVLAKNDGFIAKLKPLVKNYLGSALGSGKQYISWIHIHDLTNLFASLVEGKINPGTYNAVAPNPIPQLDLMKIFASTIGKRIILPACPSFVLRLVVGQLSEELLSDQKAIPRAALDAGYQFKFKEAEPALRDLLG